MILTKATPRFKLQSKAPELRVLDETHHDSAHQLVVSEVVVRVVTLAQAIAEKKFYPYQVELGSAVVESMLNHDGEVITGLMARQGGKTTTIGATSAAIGLIFPRLAVSFSKDWHLNITDEKGVYRGYQFGVKMGIYAPRLDQSNIVFLCVKGCLDTDTGKRVLGELGLSYSVNNGNRVVLTNGTRILCESASEQSKIEGETHHLCICDETQDISDIKLRKSLHPMTAATRGTIIKIGTASTRKCDFYTSIKHNQRTELIDGRKRHFFYPYVICQEHNSLYRKYIEQEVLRLGPDSDEFRISYSGQWIFERGMFVTQEQLFHREVALVDGLFSLPWSLQQFNLFSKQYSIVAGIDWGSTSDSTVVILIAVDWTKPLESGFAYDASGEHSYIYFKKCLVGWREWAGDDYETQFAEMTEYLNTIPNLRKVVTDSNTCGKPIFDRLVAVYNDKEIQIEPFNFQVRIKSEAYRMFYADICARRFTFPASLPTRQTTSYKKFVNQMLDLRKDYKNGLMFVSHPSEKGAKDDYPDAACLACWGANTPAISRNMDFLANNPFF